ncbi:MAG: hypothetical protein HC905_11925 [Bacteroidales bacterium]|nr:hypothetical protein [Bacteroidales bacterium]
MLAILDICYRDPVAFAAKSTNPRLSLSTCSCRKEKQCQSNLKIPDVVHYFVFEINNRKRKMVTIAIFIANKERNIDEEPELGNNGSVIRINDYGD